MAQAELPYGMTQPTPARQPVESLERQAEREELRRLNRTLRALSHSSQAMVRAKDELAYLQEVCGIVVEDCGHAMVWIGYAEDDADKTVRPVAYAGFEKGYLETLRLTWADTERGRGPTGTAIRTGKPSSCKDMLTDPRFAPWRDEALKRGYASVISVPLMAEGRVFGAINIYSREPDPFSTDEQILLAELAADVAHGISALRLRAGRALAEEARRRSEAERDRLLEALEERDRRKDEFLAMLSHELRNPLAPIKNSLYVLERAPAGGEQAQRARAVISRQVEHMTRLIDDLLDVTRVSSGKIQLRRERVELNALVLQTVEDHRTLFTRSEVLLETHTATAEIWVDADRTRLAQVVGNLLSNAAKFTSRGGRATVAVELDAGQAVVRVRDTGTGIAPAMLPRLFQPFTQAEATLDRSRGGLGLGLALVKGLVESHGGSVSVASELGKGTEFQVRLPVEAPGLSNAAPVHLRQEAGTSRRVLIIEDNADAAESLQEVFEFAGHVVEVARTGTAGVDKARTFAPDVVLCDLGLPEMDGFEVARALRAVPALRGIALVALSGYATPEDVARAHAAGFDRHLAKPPRVEVLLALLEDAPGLQLAGMNEE